MLGQPLIGAQLRDLRAAYRHVRSRMGGTPRDVAILGDSSFAALPANVPFAHPHRVDRRPAAMQPTGALLVLLLGLFEDDVTSVEARHGLVSFQSSLDSPFVQVPHDCIVPGVLREGDLDDLVAALAPRQVRLGQLADGRGRAVSPADARAAYASALRAFQAAGAENRLEFAESGPRD